MCSLFVFLRLFGSEALSAAAIPLKFYVADHIATVAEPFTVLFVCGLLHADFALGDEFFKPVFTSDKFGRNSFAERDTAFAEYKAYQVELVAG